MKQTIMTSNDFLKAISLFLLPLLLFSCNSGKSAVEAEEVLPEDVVELRADQIKLAGVELGSAEMRTIGNSVRVNGTISVAPECNATVCMPFGGFIKSTSLLPGNRVSKGQVLAAIENQDFINIQQDYLEARNKLLFAEADFKRHTELYQNDVYSEQNVQQVTMEYKNLKAQTRSLEEKLKLIGVDPSKLSEDNLSSTVYLTSPIQGYLKSVNVNIGKYVSPTDVLFEIVNSDKLFLELTLFEKDADKMVAGQKAKFYINNENEEHTAVITQAGKTIGNDKTFRAYASVTSSCAHLLPGMYVSVVVESSAASVLAVPSEAVVSFDDRDFIFIYDKEKTEDGNPFTEYRMLMVTKGVSSDGYTEIKLPEGLDIKNMKIVVKGSYNLLSAKKNAGEMAC
jgi:cobalt-zinc-cadmium efflux system membrane fusion protein